MAQLPFSPNEQRILRVMAEGFKKDELGTEWMLGKTFGGNFFRNLTPSKKCLPFENIVDIEKSFGDTEISKFMNEGLLRHYRGDIFTFDSQTIINLVDSNFISVDSLLNPDNFQIAISYSRKQKTFVDSLVGYLKQAYRNTWYDIEIPGGERWWAVIQREIEARDLFIFVLTKASWASEYCQKELAEARKADKPILPIRLTNVGDEEIELGKLPPELAEFQVISINTDPIDADGLSKLFGAIIRRAW